jgi:hypothetical protein
MKMRPSKPARHSGRRTSLAGLATLAMALVVAPALYAQTPDPMPAETAAPGAPSVKTPAVAPAPAAIPPPPSSGDDAAVAARPLAIVALDSKIPGAAAEVTGGMKVFNGRAFISSDASITSGSQTAQITLPYRGTLRVCTGTTVKLTADSSIPSGEIPGLLMALDHGAVEASFATGRNSDILLTPDFRILIGGPGAAEVKVRLGQGGDTCVDNAGVNAPYVLVSSVFDGGAYRVQAGQRVMFQHGNLHEVVDTVKEPCGCPPGSINGNEFPLAQSEGLAPTLHPAPIPAGPRGQQAEGSGALVYNGAEKAAKPDTKPDETAPTAAPPPVDAPATPPATPPAAEKKKSGFFRKVGHFFKRVFGAD